MSLGTRIRQLRKERSWSQDEFAYEAGIDGRQVSRYENDKVTPSVEVVIRIAQAFNVSLDFLLLEEIPRRSLNAGQSRLAQRVLQAEDLTEQDEASLMHLIDALEAKNKFKAVAAGVR